MPTNKTRPPTDPGQDPVRSALENIIRDLTGGDNLPERRASARRYAQGALTILDGPATPFTGPLDHLRLIVVCWEGDTELWSLALRKVICVSRDGNIKPAD